MSSLANALGRVRPLLAVAAAAAALCALPMSSAFADYAPPGSPGTVSSGTVEVNGDVTFGGTGFTPAERIDIVVTPASTNPTAGADTGALTAHVELIALSSNAVVSPAFATTVKANTSGSFSTSVHLSTAGTYWLVATGRTSHHVVSATIKVLAATTGGKGGGGTDPTGSGGKGGGGLSFTGARLNFATVAWLGVGAISLGIAFLRLGATRRRQEGLDRPTASAL